MKGTSRRHIVLIITSYGVHRSSISSKSSGTLETYSLCQNQGTNTASQSATAGDTDVADAVVDDDDDVDAYTNCDDILMEMMIFN